MKKDTKTIMVITPYTKRFGVAVFCRSELVHFAVKTLPAPRTIDSIRDETSRHVARLITEFTPSVVVVKTLSGSQKTCERHQQIERTVREVALAKGIKAENRCFEAIKEQLVGKRLPTMGETFAKLRQIHPELTRLMHFQNRSQREYYSPLLTAVTIGFGLRSRASQADGGG